MTIDKAKVEFFLSELRKRGKEITGGTPGKKRPSYELRDPEYYWDFGSFLVEQAQQVDEDQRHTWIRRQTIDIEKEIIGSVTDDDNWLIPKIYTIVDELQDKEHFMYVADIAGHKVGSFRFKVLGYIDEIYSKKNPSDFTESKKNKLAEKLQNKLTHEQVNAILREFRGKTLGYGIRTQFDALSSRVEDAVNTENHDEMELLRNEIGLKMINKLRTFLQILSISTDASLFDELCTEHKTTLNSKISTNNDSAKKLVETFKDCIKNVDKKGIDRNKEFRKKILKKISSYDMGQANTFLNAIKSKADYVEWKRTKEGFEQGVF